MIRIFNSICCRKSLVVLAYHSVSDGLTPISIKTEEFRRQMQYLKDAGYKAIGLKDYIEIIENKKNISGKKVLITFDDGHKDVYENALSILKEFNFPAVLSVNPAYVGKKAEFAPREKDKERDICSLEEIRELAKNGFSIINHGFNHKDFTKLSEKEIVFEYEEAKKWIADNIETNCFPDIFVFPKNSRDKNLEAFLKKRGARLIFGERVDVYPGKSINYFALNLNRFFRWLRKNKLWIGAIFCVLAIKVILGVLLLNNIPNTGLPADFFIFSGGDDINYVSAARHILSGNFLSSAGLAGYSIFIAMVMTITGKTALPAIAFPLVFANVFIFSTAVAVLSMLIVKKFWNKISYAFFAGLSVIALPYLWFFLMKNVALITASGAVDKAGLGRALQLFGLPINSDWFSAFLVCLGVWFFLNANYGYSGLFFGLSFLVRAQNVLFLLFLFALLIFSKKIKESLSFGAGGFIGGFLQLYLNYRMTGSPFVFAAYSSLLRNDCISFDDCTSFSNILNLPMKIIDKAPYLLILILLFIVISILSLKYFYKNREKFYFLLTSGIVIPAMLFTNASSVRNPRYFLPFIPVFLVFLIGSFEVLFLKKKSYNSSQIMKVENFKKENIKSFSSPEAVKAYSSKYLRSSEEYVIKKYMPPGCFVLDVGCGTGRTTDYIYKNKCRVIGIDLAEPLVNKARELYPDIDFRIMDASKLEFADNTFDAVFFSFNGIDNFSSLEERSAALMELMRVLKPGGFLAYSSHNSIAIPRTSASWKILFKNFGKCKIGPHWRIEDHGFGKLFQYYNNAWNESRQLKRLGLNLVEIIANGKVAKLPRFLMPFLERFPMYIIKK